MFVKIIDIDVPILKFDEETNVILTGKVPLSLRQHIYIVLKERVSSGEAPQTLRSIVEVDSIDYLAEYYLINNPSTIYTIPYKETDHHITKALAIEKELLSHRPRSQLHIKLLNRL